MSERYRDIEGVRGKEKERERERGRERERVGVSEKDIEDIIFMGSVQSKVKLLEMFSSV